MTSYDTKAVKVGGVTITVSKEVGDEAGDRVIALLKFIAKWMHAGKPPENGIDNSLPEGPPSGGGPVDPGYGQGEAPGKPPSVNPPRPGHPLPGDQPEISNDLPSWIANNAEEVVKAVLKNCFECNTAQPHRR